MLLEDEEGREALSRRRARLVARLTSVSTPNPFLAQFVNGAACEHDAR